MTREKLHGMSSTKEGTDGARYGGRLRIDTKGEGRVIIRSFK